MLKSLRIPLAFLITGIVWAFISDPIITLFFGHLTAVQQDLLRSFNDLLFVIIIAVVLYLEIGRQQRKLTRSEEQYRQLFESNPNPMWIYNMDDFKFIKVNNAAIAKYGYSMKEFLNMNIFEIRPSKDHQKIKKFIEEIKDGIKSSGVWEHIKANGETFKASIVSHTVKFENKNCSMVMATDITELLDKEEKLQQAHQKIKKHNETLLDITWSNSHELRKPLCSILSLVNLLQQPISEQEKTECLTLLQQCATELDEMSRKNNEKLDKLEI